jgi:hypothetical protein
MNKRLFILGLVFVGLMAFPKFVMASEGTALLASQDNDARCFVASVLVNEGDYQVVMTCRNLTTPPDANRLFYLAWARRKGATEGQQAKTGGLKLGKGAYFSLGDISGGKLNARAREAFEEVLVTAEADSGVSQPSLSALVVSGPMGEIDFGDSGQSNLKFSPTSTIARVTLAPTPGKTVIPVAQKSVAGTAARVFLTILAIIVVGAIVISVIQRRSASR